MAAGEDDVELWLQSVGLGLYGKQFKVSSFVCFTWCHFDPIDTWLSGEWD